MLTAPLLSNSRFKTIPISPPGAFFCPYRSTLDAANWRGHRRACSKGKTLRSDPEGPQSDAIQTQTFWSLPLPPTRCMWGKIEQGGDVPRSTKH